MQQRVLIPQHIAPLPRRTGTALAVETLGGETMGTVWSARFVAPPEVRSDTLRRELEAVLARIVAQMSTWTDQSDISRFNDAKAGSWHELPAEFFTVLRTALDVAEDSGGAFDPGIGALVDLWGFGPRGGHAAPPSADAIARAHDGGGWQKLRLDRTARKLLQPGGVALDLSGVAKGFAVDTLGDCLDRHGIHDYLVEIGGEFRGQGVKPDMTPWWVELDGPQAEQRTIVALHGLSVATSGDAQRAFLAGGRRYSHTIDPRSGEPVPERLAMVSVIHRHCMQADALATAILVLGPEAGYDFACRNDIAARMVLRGDGPPEIVTPAFAAMLD